MPCHYMYDLVKMYESGMTGTQIAKQLGIGRDAVYRRLKKTSYTPKSPSRAARRHTLDERYFEHIDTEAKAYWLGFLGADGNVCGNLLQIDLAASDRAHLEKLRVALASSHPVVNRQVEYLQARFAISNKTLVADLAKHGLLPKKSLTLVPWSGPSDLQRHYWRGMVDGDGSLFYSSNKWAITLVGSLATCEAFSAWIRSLVPEVSANVHAGHGNCWEVRVNGNRAVPVIIKQLYDRATVFLDRKMERAQLAMDMVAILDAVR